MTKVQLHLLTGLVVAAGLLLGGNVNADTTTATTTSATATNDAVQVQIQTIKDKIQALTAEIKSNQKNTVTAVAPVARPALTQAQLDTIEVAVKRIAQETERIKAQVQILVKMRDIVSRIAAIRTQIAAMNATGTVPSGSGAAGSPVASVPVSGLNEEQKEARIAQIRQQIGELNQELLNKRAAEAAQAASSVAASTCTGPSCAASTSADQPVTIQVSPKPTEAASKPGFWQSIGNFVRKIFTF